jgi:predicted phosphodiesterase
MKIAVVADIHGNRWALEAVLGDLRSRGIEKALNLGDSFYGPLDPAGTADLLIELDFPAVRGNEDRILIEPSRHHPNSATLDFAKAQLKPAYIEWLKALPRSRIAFKAYFLCHGTPDADDRYLLRTVTESGVVQKSPGQLAEIWPDRAVSVLLCGHDHLPGLVRLSGDRMILNPGSVGLPAYQDDKPFPHQMEAGSPHARYSVISDERNEISVEQILVEYDWKAASKTALKNGRPDWAAWLMNGKAALCHDQNCE